MIREEDLIFLTFVGEDYSRSGVLRGGMANSNFLLLPYPGLKLIYQLIRLKHEKTFRNKILVVMSPAHILVLFLRFILPNRVVLDAGWPLLDGVVSRQKPNRNKLTLRFFKYYMLDYLCLHLSHAVALESNQQLQRCMKLFRLKEGKSFQSFTGFNETEVTNGVNDLICPLLDMCPECNPKKDPVILFRGKCNAEAGLEVLASATNELSSHKLTFVIATNRFLTEFHFSNKTVVLTEFLGVDQIAHLYKAASISIGQLSNNPRLRFTIPHKAFEAAFFQTPYLTVDAIGVRELFSKDSEVILYNPEGKLLSKVIVDALEDSQLVKRSVSANETYRRVASQDIVARNFLAKVNTILLKQ